MTNERWREIALQIKPHLDAIREIAEANEIDTLCMSTNLESHYFNAFTIEDGTKEEFTLSDFEGHTYINYEPIGDEQDESLQESS